MKTICRRFSAWALALGCTAAIADIVPTRGADQGTPPPAATPQPSANEALRPAPAKNKRAPKLDFYEDSIVMHAGEVKVLETGEVDRVAIGNGKVASSTVLDKKRLLIIAQDVGDTNILLWNKTRPIGNLKLRVTALDIERQKKEIAAMLSDVPNLTVGNAGDRIFVDGADLSPDQLARVKTIKEQFPNVIDRTRGVLQPEKPASPSTMVMFDLYFLEFKKTYLQNLGVSWDKTFNGFNFGVFQEFASGPGTLRPGATETTYKDLPKYRVNGLSTTFNVAVSVASMINLAVNNGEATLLAAPKLAVRSGGTAKFLAGGEFPITISNSVTGNTVQYKQYGIILEVEPKVNSDKTVSGVIRAEVSALDATVTVNGYPGLLKRRTETDFHSPMGNAIVLSGLYSQEMSNAMDKVPLLGDVPLLKALFSNKSDDRKNTELVVFIVPNAHSSEEPVNQQVISRAADLSTERNTDIVGNDILPHLTLDSNLWHGMEGKFTRTLPKPERPLNDNITGQEH